MPRPVLDAKGYPTKPNSFHTIIKRDEIDPIKLGNALASGEDVAITVRHEKKPETLTTKVEKIAVFRQGLVAHLVPKEGSYLGNWPEALLYYPHETGPAGILNMPSPQ